MEVDPTPTTGSMGLMTAGQDSYSYSSGTGFEEEPPLLEGKIKTHLYSYNTCRSAVVDL